VSDVVIGLTCSDTRASWGAWREYDVALLPFAYVDRVAAAGALPLLLPPVDPSLAPAAVARIDALVLTGGADLDPSCYGAQPHPETVGCSPRRDAWELALARAAAAADLPVLGVCRGLQLLNVAYGGDLDQHLEAVGAHRSTPGTFDKHAVRVEGGVVEELVGASSVAVASHHHQGIARLGEGLTATAYAEDGTIEALEDPSRRFCVGVLWHPEETDGAAGTALFDALVREAREYRSGRA
jgi:putative glutamine amidotransferase